LYHRSIRIITSALGFSLLVLAGPLSAQVLEEIIVTAQKREEAAQNVANPVSVFSAEDIQSFGIKEPKDLAMQTPGLLTKLGPNGLLTVSFYLRGVGLNDFSGTVDSSVGVYVDEVYKPTPDTLNFAIMDVERVEVLKGPQGTLYGRNSTGGAVNIISARPTEEVEGYVRAGYERYDAATAEAALSGPIMKQLLGRISVAGQLKDSDSGYSFNRFTGNTIGDDDRAALRGQLHWLPRDDFDIRVVYNYGYQESEQPLLEGIQAFDPATGGVCAPVIAGRRAEGECVGLPPLLHFDPDDNRFDTEADVEPMVEIEDHNAALHVNWRLPRFAITAITGYENFEKEQAQDLDASRFRIGNNDTINSQVDSISQEVRFTSDESWPFSWILGGFYFDSDINWFQTIDLRDAVGVDTSNGADQDTESWAVFGDVTIPVADRFELEGGVRFTHEERDWFGGSVVGTFSSLEEALALTPAPPLSALPVPPGCCLFGPVMQGGPLDFDTHIEEDNVDFRAALKFHLNDDMMFYMSVSEGFRSGGFSGAVILSQAALEPFDVESLRAYEGGFKMNLMNGRMQFNASGFFYDFEGYQATFVRGTEVSARLQNAGDVEIFGAEATVKWLITDLLYVDGGLTWLDNEIVDSDVGLVPLEDLTAPPVSIEGNEITNAPEWSFNGRARYELPMVGSFRPYLQGDFKYVDEHFLEPNNRLILQEDGYFLLNGRLSFEQENGPWYAGAWVRNLTDEQYLSSGQDVIAALFFAHRIQGPPRTYGVEIGYRF
jgi:iron complex outermembrane receptor protein